MRVMSFNLYNFAHSDFWWYERKSANRHTGPGWERKLAWIREKIAEIEPDIVGFQEVFSVDELRALCEELELPHFAASGTPGVLDTDPNVFTAPVVAIAARFPFSVRQTITISEAMRRFLRLAEDTGFSRLPLVAEFNDGPFPGLAVITAHLKSKRPIIEGSPDGTIEYPDTMSWEDRVFDTMTRTSRGQIASMLQRGAEAAAIYEFLATLVLADRNRPIVVLGDLNDDEHSVTLESLQMVRRLYEIGTQSLAQAENWQRAVLYTFRFTDAYHLAPQQSGVVRPETYRFMGRPSTIDYIMVSNGLNEFNRVGHVGRVAFFDVANSHIADLTGEFSRADKDKSDHGLPYADIVPRAE